MDRSQTRRRYIISIIRSIQRGSECLKGGGEEEGDDVDENDNDDGIYNGEGVIVVLYCVQVYNVEVLFS